MTKYIIPYVRFSKVEQKKGASLQRQVDRINEYAKTNGYELYPDLKFQDLGFSAWSGKNVSHGALGVFLEAIRREIIPTDGSIYLCIEQIDRLTRQDIDSASEIFKSILRNNVNIITLMDSKIYTKDSLRSFVDIMYSLFLMEQAYVESQKKSERILNVFEQRKEKVLSGEKIQFTGMFPGWIDNNGSKEKTDFIFNEKVETVRKVFDFYGNKGKSLRDITNWLDQNNIPQIAKKRQKNFTNRWNSGRISHLLSNRCVLGELKIKKSGEVIKNYYPAAIDKELFDKVQSIRKRKIKVKAAGRKSINVFTGKLFCGKCGQKVYFETDDKTVKGKKYLYYTLKCSAKRYGGCNSKTVTYHSFLGSHPNDFDIFGTEFIYPKSLIIKKKAEIDEIEKELKFNKDKLEKLEVSFEKNLNFDTDLFLKQGTKLKSTVRNLGKILENLLYEYNRYTQNENIEYPISNMDKLLLDEDPEEIAKAKRIIDRNYSAIIIFSDQKQAVTLRYNGLYEFINWGDYKSTKNLIKNFSTFTNDLMKSWISGKIDGKFDEILQSIFFWGKDKLSAKKLSQIQIEEVKENPAKLSEYDLGLFIMNHWDRDTIEKRLKKLNIKYLPHPNDSKATLNDLFGMKEKHFEYMEKNIIEGKKQVEKYRK